MNSERIREITTDRLREWGEVAVEKHTTPGLLICIGHDHAQGEMHVMVPDGVDESYIRKLLQKVLSAMTK